LLGSILRDPFYRYEVRRYWTWRRYIWLYVALILWLGLVWFWLRSGAFPLYSRDEVAVFLIALSLLGRAPLSFMASTGAALCIAPEKVSGQLEQFVMTPLDPWRYCLARMAGRLEGLWRIWVVLSTIVCVGALALATTGQVPRDDHSLLVLVAAAALQLDLAVMLVTDAAVGMRFTAASSSTAAALVKTYLANFVLSPFAMFMGGLTGALLAAVVTDRVLDWGSREVVLAGFLCWFAARLALGALAVRVALRDARNAMQRTFYRPEDRQ
jgi:hypothetical protein